MCMLNYGNLLKRNVPTVLKHSRAIWGYVAIAFNQVDVDRLKLVGPDRLCAEWLLKNGGSIRMTENPDVLWHDYNTLPPENRKFKIKVADASNSSIMKIGFPHFIGCSLIDTVILNKCKYLEEGSLEGLIHLRDSLINLEVAACDDLHDIDLKAIANLTKLKMLVLGQLINVTDMNKLVKDLQGSLPQCEITLK